MPRTIAGRRRTDSGTLPQWVAPQQTRPRSSLAEASVSPSFFFRVPEKTPRTVWRCQPVALATSSTINDDFLDGRRDRLSKLLDRIGFRKKNGSFNEQRGHAICLTVAGCVDHPQVRGKFNGFPS